VPRPSQATVSTDTTPPARAAALCVSLTAFAISSIFSSSLVRSGLGLGLVEALALALAAAAAADALAAIFLAAPPITCAGHTRCRLQR